MRPLLLRLFAAALLLPACTSGDPKVVAIEQSPGAQVSPPTLQPPDADEPEAGACAEAQGSEAVMTFANFPDPTCLIVTADQRLRVVNRLDREVQVELGSVNLIVRPGFDGVVGSRFGDYLAPGVHFLRQSVYEDDPEIWLK